MNETVFICDRVSEQLNGWLQLVEHNTRFNFECLTNYHIYHLYILLNDHDNKLNIYHAYHNSYIINICE